MFENTGFNENSMDRRKLIVNLTMEAVVLKAPKEAVIEKVARPDPKADEVIVKVGACGVCGTDLKIFQGDYLSPYPLIPGHEISGTIVSVGHDVSADLIGMNVGVDPTLNCGVCGFCRAGAWNHCETWGAIGDTVNGGFATYTAVPARNIYPLQGMSFTAGALVEPMACAVWALERLAVRPGMNALIFGAGPMGIILMSMLLRYGVVDAVMVDKSQERLDVAARLGARTVIAGEAMQLKKTFSQGFDLVVDATGVPKVAEQALSWVRKAGTFLLFGVNPQGAKIEIEPFEIYHKEITIVSSMAINRSYAAAMEMSRHHVINADMLVTHKLPFAKYNEAINLLKSGSGMKIQLVAF